MLLGFSTLVPEICFFNLSSLLETDEAMVPALPFPPSGSFTWLAAPLVLLLWVAAMNPRPWASEDRALEVEGRTPTETECFSTFLGGAAFLAGWGVVAEAGARPLPSLLPPLARSALPPVRGVGARKSDRGLRLGWARAGVVEEVDFRSSIVDWRRGEGDLLGRKEGDLTPMPARMGEALLVRGEEREDLVPGGALMMDTSLRREGWREEERGRRPVASTSMGSSTSTAKVELTEGRMAARGGRGLCCGLSRPRPLSSRVESTWVSFRPGAASSVGGMEGMEGRPGPS